jgi:hypothetical protein
MAIQSTPRNKLWYERISRTGYFFGAVLLHLILFVMIGTQVIFPAFVPPHDNFTQTYLPNSAAPPPPPPPTPVSVQVPTQVYSSPGTTITSQAPTASFTVPIPNITATITPTAMSQPSTQTIQSNSAALSTARLAMIAQTEQKSWGRDSSNIRETNGDPRNVVAKFPVYLASYAGGDWYCNNYLDKKKKIFAGSLPNLIAKINEWSKGHITGEVEPVPLNLAGTDLLDKKPPFIFFTGHKDFVLTGQEIKNLQDYLQIGGCIWGDNALPGVGSRFDVAFRREMKRVVPDVDKNFEPVPPTSDIFTKSWFPLARVAQGMNYYAEPLEHLDIDGKLAILYTPNDYSDMFTMRILPGDTSVQSYMRDPSGLSPLVSDRTFMLNSDIFFRNYDLAGCLACDQMGMNIIGYMLVRFDNVLQLTP